MRREIKGLAILSLVAASCGSDINGNNPIDIFPTEPRATEVSPVPTSTQEQTPTIAAVPLRSYPTSDANFILGAGGPLNAEERLMELGAGPDIGVMGTMLLSEFGRMGVSADRIEWLIYLNESYPVSSWTLMARDTGSGEIYWPRLTAGPEAGQLVRSGNLFQYIGSYGSTEDFFDLEKLPSAGNLGEVEQDLVVDESGWYVAVMRSKRTGEPYLWFNADQERWESLSDFVPNGAVGVDLLDDTWVARDTSGIVRLGFVPQSQEWQSVQTPEEIIENTANFSDRGSLVSQSGALEVHYSDFLMSNAMIRSLQLDPQVMEDTWSMVVREGYSITGSPVGTPMRISGVSRRGGEYVPADPIYGLLERTTIYTVGEWEFGRIEEDLERLESINPDFKYTELDMSVFGATSPIPVLAFFNSEGRLIMVQRSHYLRQVDQWWDRQDAAYRLIGDGFVHGIGVILNTLSFRSGGWNTGPIYEAFGCTRSNNSCRDGDTGLFTIDFY